MSTATLSSAPATGARGSDADGSGAAAPKKSKKKLIIIAVLVLAVAGVGVWFFLLRGGGGEKKVAKPEKGAVMVVEPISINLADGHYLKIGFGLQLTKKVKEDPDPSQALSIAIDQLSGQSMDKLSAPVERRKAIEKLTAAVEKAYEGEVMGLYPTTLVMQ